MDLGLACPLNVLNSSRNIGRTAQIVSVYVGGKCVEEVCVCACASPVRRSSEP